MLIGPIEAFIAGLMLLAALILLAACANLGSLFAARAANRLRAKWQLRLALGSSRNRILRGLFTEAVLISPRRRRSRTLGQRGRVALAQRPGSRSAISQCIRSVNPRCHRICELLFLLTLPQRMPSLDLFRSGQVLRVSPYDVRQSGIPRAKVGAPNSPPRDLLLILQISDLHLFWLPLLSSRARTGAIAAREFRFRSTALHPGQRRSSHGRLHPAVIGCPPCSEGSSTRSKRFRVWNRSD